MDQSPQEWRRQINKSDSGRSVRSTGSHDSVPTLGSHPFGTLHVHQPENPSPLSQSNRPGADDDDDNPPPLEGDEIVPDAESRQVSHGPRPSGDGITHDMRGGDVVLILGLPELFTVGYDSISFNAKHFGGIRDFPPGPHFLWAAHPSGASTRYGVWIMTDRGNHLHTLQWDTYNETLCDSTRAEARIQADNIASIHEKLIPYDDPTTVNDGPSKGPHAGTSLSVWPQLTSGISSTVLDRVTGQQGGNWFLNTSDRVRGSLMMAAEVELDRRLSGSRLQHSELNFSFSQLNKTYSTVHTGAERTLEATDATLHILSLLDDASRTLRDDDVIGEFQFAFIVGMHLGNDSCMQQWWHMLLKLILRAHLLPLQRPLLAAALFRSLAAQLSYSTDYLDASILDYSEKQSSELRLALTIYKRRLEELLETDASPDQLSVVTAFTQVESTVAGPPLEWDLRSDNYVRRGKLMMEDGEEVEVEMGELEAEDERGEWAPEVVELDDTGRQKGLVSWTD